MKRTITLSLAVLTWSVTGSPVWAQGDMSSAAPASAAAASKTAKPKKNQKPQKAPAAASAAPVAASTPGIKPVPPQQPGRSGPRVLSPAEQREVNSPPLDTPPSGNVQPQLSIPLGRAADKVPATSPTRAQSNQVRSGGSSTGGVDDSAARCSAETDEQARTQCLQKAGSGR